MNKAFKSCLSAFALLLPLCAMSTNHSGEYYWNSDPGIGHALKMPVTDVGADGIMYSTLDATGAHPGVNILGLRVFNGKWSPTVVQYVFVPVDPASITTAVCEYWWDSDPGIGFGSQLTTSTSGTGTIKLDFDAASLTPGIHTLGFRTGINGMWSPTVTRHVFVPQAAASITQTTCEYWWDKDPGVGMCTDVVTAPTNGNGAIDLNLKAEDLTPGLHLLGIRSNINGHWSATVTAPVFVRDNVVSVIDAAEYFWGADPGYGNGTPIDLTAAESVEIKDLKIDFPATAQAEYVLTLRAHSSVGGWGYSIVKTFTPVEATGITIEPEEFRFGYPGMTQTFTAVPEPSDAWIDGVEWSSSDTSVATVDSKGNVTSVSIGECVVTARLKGTEFYAESIVTVDNEDLYPLGDSNGSMEVNITDVATTVGYVLGSEIEKFIFKAADVTCNNEISTADAVGTVNIIFGLPVEAAYAPARTRIDIGQANISNFSLNSDGYGQLTIDLANNIPITAMQFDLCLPEGVILESVENGARAAEHRIEWSRIDDSLYRVIIYSTVNEQLSGNRGTLLQIGLRYDELEGTLPKAIARDVRVVECNAVEHKLPDMEAEVGKVCETESVISAGMRIFTEGKTLHIISDESTSVVMTTIDGISCILDVKEGENSYDIGVSGVYIVNGIKIIIY